MYIEDKEKAMYRTRATNRRNRYFSDSEELKNALTIAFKRVKKKIDIYTRQNFLCCRTCAGYNLELKNEERIKKGEKGKAGYIFYCRQDNDDVLKKGYVYLSYGGFEENDTDTSLSIAKSFIEEIEKEEGIKVHWNGEASSCIFVYHKNADVSHKNADVSKIIPS